MTATIGTFERLIAEWREAEARLELLRQFESNGGEHRIVIGIDDGDAVVARALDEMLGKPGYRAILSQSIRHAERRVEECRTAFEGTAMSSAATREETVKQ